MQRLADQTQGEDIQVLGINIGEDVQTINEFATLYDIKFSLLLDESTSSPPLWRLRGLPTTYLVDTRGDVAAAVLGEREWDEPLYQRQISLA